MNPINTNAANSIRHPHQTGITLIELVIVIIVISILTAIATAKISSSNITVGQQAEQFATDIRHVQSLAINWGCELTLTITATPSQYEVTSKQAYANKPCNVAAAIIKDPISQQNFTITLSNGVRFTADSTFYFDSFGRPINAAGTIINVDTSFDLTSGGISYRVTIIRLSGYVTVVKV